MNFQQSKDTVFSIRTLVTLFYAFILIKTAWMCDDAFITMRTVDNFVHGLGLTWNVGERVQSFTHPLWLFILSFFYAFIRDAYFVPLFVSFVLSMTAFGIIIWKVAKDTTQVVFCALVLCCSKAFVDFSSSGLESPLAYVLFALFILHTDTSKEKPNSVRLLRSALLLSLIALTRLDLVAVTAPYFLWELYSSVKHEGTPWKSMVRWVAVGFSPLIAWELFSIVYYGFPFPNTAYAKLATGLPAVEVTQQGLMYFVNSLRWDTLTLLLIVWVGVLSVYLKKLQETLFMAGILLYFVFVIKAGGDFMSGRFLAIPFFVAVFFIPRISLPKRTQLIVSGCFIAVILVTMQHKPGEGTVPAAAFERKDSSGIADERGMYFAQTGLVNWQHGCNFPYDHEWARRGLSLKSQADARGPITTVEQSTGLLGFAAGPKVHIIDQYALSDPFLARLPAMNTYFGMRPWRIGHFCRRVPSGYSETVDSGKNCIADRSLSEYYGHLSTVVHGKLFTLNRFREIWMLNTGRYHHLPPEKMD